MNSCERLKAKAMTDDNRDNPYAPPVPVEDETQKPLQNVIARRWCSCMFDASVIPLLLVLFAGFMETVFGGIWHIDYGLGYGLLGLTCFSALFAGFPASIVALVISLWQRRFQLAFASLILMVCNLLWFAYAFRTIVIISC